MTRREQETLGALRRELGRALQAFSAPLSATMRLFAQSKDAQEGADGAPADRFRGLVEACGATLRELRRMTGVVEAMRDLLSRRGRTDRTSLPGGLRRNRTSMS
jgi:hypothetical protein